MPEATVADCLKKMKILQKDLEYLGGLAEKWTSQIDRFPLIVEGIGQQRENFNEMIGTMKECRVVDIPFPVTVSKEVPDTLVAPEDNAQPEE
ncbi:MAG: hypothetical protein E3J72_22480 [Planctomycetota bacterium]|nr:MAG: hypothetical protein E3J72_22480 [Planctomycetota bacterium]